MNYYFIRKLIVSYAVCHAIKLEIVQKNFGLGLGLISGSVIWTVALTSQSLS